jgi:hypothetical protein
MAAPADPFDPFDLAASTKAWCCLLRAAQELRDIDREMMETMMESEVVTPAALPPDIVSKAREKAREAARLMRSLDLDPDAVRHREPQTMRELEAACQGCRERDRCQRELRDGMAAATHSDFCPNAARLDRLRHA